MWDQIKQVLDNIGGRFVIAEGGKPRYIVLAFEEFKNLLETNHKKHSESSVLEPQVSSGSDGKVEFEYSPEEDLNMRLAEVAREQEDAEKLKIEEVPLD